MRTISTGQTTHLAVVESAGPRTKRPVTQMTERGTGHRPLTFTMRGG